MAEKQDQARLSVHEILATATADAKEELARSRRAVAVSGVSAGLTMGLTAAGVAVMTSYVGEGGGREAVVMLLYPLGFIAVIVGRMQLFTENTLFPVVLTLAAPRFLGATARLWGLVFAGNIVGALAFALLAARTSSLPPDALAALTDIGARVVDHSAGHVFWSGVVGGWIIALVAWLVTASRLTLAQLLATFIFTYLVGLGHFAHCIAGSCEVLSAVVRDVTSIGDYGRWLLLATAGNALGGVVMVSLLNYAQANLGEERVEI